MNRAYANYKINSDETITVYCECLNTEGVFTGKAPMTAKGAWFDKLYNWIDKECTKRNWHLERLISGI